MTDAVAEVELGKRQELSEAELPDMVKGALVKGKGEHKGKGQGKPTGWEGPYADVLGRRYWTYRNYKWNGQSRTRRYYEDDDENQ